jgi:nucleoside-diphosphate-sugar epimerase
MAENILILGSCGQVGTDLVEELRNIYGNDRVIVSDIRKPEDAFWQNGPFELLDVLDKGREKSEVRMGIEYGWPVQYI